MYYGAMKNWMLLLLILIAAYCWVTGVFGMLTCTMNGTTPLLIGSLVHIAAAIVATLGSVHMARKTENEIVPLLRTRSWGPAKSAHPSGKRDMLEGKRGREPGRQECLPHGGERET